MKKVVKDKEKENGAAPIFTKRLGAISGNIFENRTDDRVYYNVQITRRYRANDGAWHDSNVLNGEADVCLLIEVLESIKRFLQERSIQVTDNEQEG